MVSEVEPRTPSSVRFSPFDSLPALRNPVGQAGAQGDVPANGIKLTHCQPIAFVGKIPEIHFGIYCGSPSVTPL